MKNLKRILAVALLVLTLTALVACGKEDLIGTWEGKEGDYTVTYVFNKDGTGTCSSDGVTVNITYTADDTAHTIDIKADALGQNVTQSLSYEIKKSELTLTSSGASVKFTKK
jgi:hypothetical protein